MHLAATASKRRRVDGVRPAGTTQKRHVLSRCRAAHAAARRRLSCAGALERPVGRRCAPGTRRRGEEGARSASRSRVLGVASRQTERRLLPAVTASSCGSHGTR